MKRSSMKASRKNVQPEIERLQNQARQHVLSLSLKVKVKVSTAGVDIVSFSATGVQNSEFTIGNAKFQVQNSDRGIQTG